MPPPDTEPFVARTDELARLQAAYEGAAAGEGSLTVVMAEAGGGKTRLIEVFGASSGVPVAWGRSVEDATVAYRPWRQAFRRLQIPFPETAHADDRSGALLATAEAAIGALDGVSRRNRPVVICLDDLQWADEASLHLLRLLASDLGGMRVLLLATSRPPEPGTPYEAALGQLLGKPAVTVLRLAPLSPSAVADYLAGHPDVRAAEWVHRQSGGNPLYVRELSRLLADEPVAPDAWSGWLPVELRTVLAHRLRHLGDPVREVVSAASVLGDEFEVALLDGLLGEPAAGRLDEAVRGGVLVLDPDTPGTARFSHGLVRSALYTDLLSARRVELHRRAAEALEDRGAAKADDQLADLALHRLRAASTPDGRRVAVERLRQAAQAANRRLAYDESARLLQSAAATARLGPASVAERAALDVELATAEFHGGRVLGAVETARRAVRLAEEAAMPDVAAAAALIVSGVGDDQTLPPLLALKEQALRLLPPAPTPLRVRLEAQIATIRAELYSPAAAEAATVAVLDAAEKLGDADALTDAIRARHVVVSGPDGVAERRRLGARMIELGSVPDRAMAALWGHLWRIDAAFQLGDLAGANAEAAALAAVVQRLRRPIADWHLLMNQASLAVTTGRFDEAMRLALDARRLGHRLEDFSVVGVTYAVVGEVERFTGSDEEHAFRVGFVEHVRLPIALADTAYIAACLGDLDAARRLHDGVKPFVPSLPRDGRWLPTLCLFGQTACELGDADLAEHCYRALAPYAAYCAAGGAGSIACPGSVSGVLARLATLLGRPDEAKQLFADAVTMNRRIGLVPYLGESLLHWAEFLALNDDPRAARPLAEEAHGIATRLGMGIVARRSRSLLDRLGAAPHRPPDPLTRREREVAGLVAEGRSNREIAEHFVLSERTVETHVSRILAKLELTSRTQLAAWVLGQPRTY